ncbi:DHH family phosphoesterase [Candidatus Saccharibacteria bacterium]|nr:DHH family phosphoesterase [Candidatus Saccharibacteria bacterium]
MIDSSLTTKLRNFVDEANNILIVQADNPDADSLGSALALDVIFSEQDKNSSLYCAVSMPTYLHYIKGWDRVSNSLPSDFDLVVIVDASSLSLLEKVQSDRCFSKFRKSQKVIIDHHEIVTDPIDSELSIIDTTCSSASELIYSLSADLGWNLPLQAQEPLMSGILGDTQGLTNSMASPSTYRVIANIIEAGVDRGELEERRRSYSKFQTSIFRYKADLIYKTDFNNTGEIAFTTVEQDDINEYSPLYNPAALIHGDMLQVESVRLAIVFKSYDDGKITASIRSNNDAPICSMLASEFGGGGHSYAGGFKIQNSENHINVISECLKVAESLLKEC